MCASNIYIAMIEVKGLIDIEINVTIASEHV